MPEAYLHVLLRVYTRSGELVREIDTSASDVKDGVLCGRTTTQF